MVLSITDQTGERIAGSATFNNKISKPFQTVLRFTGDIQDNRYLCLTLIDENPTHIHEVWAMFDLDPDGDQMKGFWLGRRVREHGISLGHMVITKEPHHRNNGPSLAASTPALPRSFELETSRGNMARGTRTAEEVINPAIHENKTDDRA